MPNKVYKDAIDPAIDAGLAKKLIDAGLPLAAEAYGADLDEADRIAVDTATCPEKDFLRRVVQIAEITADKLLAEKAAQKQKYPELEYDLALTTMTVLEIYAQRFYSYWQDGKQVYIRTEISDFSQWHNASRGVADQIFTSDELENILVISCAKGQKRKSPLLGKLINKAIDTEIIRLGHLYPDRDMARRIFAELMQKLKELLTIREQHDSSLQLGEHPEELIPYVWANIIKNLLNRQLCEALDSINALAYLHYAAEKTESITGTAAYGELKKGLFLFNEGKQCTWPNELRKLFMDPTMVEALLRYRFAHGLMAVNTALAFLAAEHKDNTLQLNSRDEDAIVLNGLLLTQTGYLRSSGVFDPSIKEQFVRDVAYFNNAGKITARKSPALFLNWQKTVKNARSELVDNLASTREKLGFLLQEKQQSIRFKEEAVSRLESRPGKENRSLLKKFLKDGHKEKDSGEIESLSQELAKDRKALDELYAIRRLSNKMAGFLNKLSGFFD